MKKVKFMAILGAVLLLISLGSGASNRIKFITAGDVTVPIATTYIDGADFTSYVADVRDAKFISITFYVKGNNASCALNVIFKFVSYDSKRDKWDTIDIFDSAGISIPANGTTAVQKSIAVIPDWEKIKLLSIQNQESVATYTVVANASIFIKW